MLYGLFYAGTTHQQSQSTYMRNWSHLYNHKFLNKCANIRNTSIKLNKKCKCFFEKHLISSLLIFYVKHKSHYTLVIERNFMRPT